MRSFLIFFIFIGLSSISSFAITSSIGMKTSYLNDKYHFSDNSKNGYIEDINNYNIYKIGAIYSLKIHKFNIKTYIDYGAGKSNDTSIKYKNILSKTRNFCSKEEIIDYGIDTSYLWRIGPLRIGPILGFDYNSQTIKNIISSNSTQRNRLRWYLPTVGAAIHIQPFPWKSWRIYSIYNFSYGRLTFDSPCSSCHKKEGMKQKLILGTCFSISKTFSMELNFTYLDYLSGSSKIDHEKIKKESIEGAVVLSYIF